MRSISLALISRTAAAAIALGCCGTLAIAQAPANLVVRAPEGGVVRALIIGVDAYKHYQPLKGAVADARDIEGSLKRMGARDVVTLIDAAADRATILREIDGLTQRTRANDLVLLTIAGHGTQEPEKVKGSEPDGLDNVFLLADFQPTPQDSQQRILGKEFNHFIKQLELRGAHVMFVADTCHGGGMAREIDPRGEPLSFRQVPSYRLTEDTLRPVSTTADAYTTELDFDRTDFLAAVDRRTKSPEVRIPGVQGLRGALSYAVARAIEGDADSNADGRVTVKELFTTVRQMVYQLSNQRQNIVAVSSPSRSIDTDVVYQITRGVNVIESDAPPAPQAQVPDRPRANPAPPQQQQQPRPTPTASPTPAPNPTPNRVERAIRIASLDGNPNQFAGVTQRDVPFEVVAIGDNPDIVWDPEKRDVIDAYGDVVAYKIDKTELPNVIDRTAAIRELKMMWSKDPQIIKIGPDDSLHRNESLVQIEVSNVKNRSLVLFNLAGDGTVQMLYPVGADLPSVPTSEYRFPVRVREPFGHDQIVAITSDSRMEDLEKMVNQLNRRKAAAQMIKMVQRFLPRDARIGSAGLYTAQ